MPLSSTIANEQVATSERMYFKMSIWVVRGCLFQRYCRFVQHRHDDKVSDRIMLSKKAGQPAHNLNSKLFQVHIFIILLKNSGITLVFLINATHRIIIIKKNLYLLYFFNIVFIANTLLVC